MNTRSLTGSHVQFGNVRHGQISNRLWLKDNTWLALLLGATLISVYFLPIGVTKLVFLVFAGMAYKTKEYDYIYLIWLFIIIDAPGRLFSATGLHDRRLPLYTLAAGVSFTFQELFLFMYIAKIYINKKKENFIFQKAFNYFFYIIGFVFLYSIFLGMDFSVLVQTIRYLLTWSWIIILPYYINNPERVLGVSRLIFPIVFVVLALQVHTFITGNYLDNILRGENFYINLAVEKGSEASRVVSSFTLLIFATTQALFFMSSKEKFFSSNNYLAGVIFCSIASVVLSATRGWTLAFGFLILASLIQISKNGKIVRLFNLMIASIVVIYVLQYSFPLIRHQFEASIDRLSTITLLLEGDVTAGGTLSRIDLRGKRVMEHFWRSPVIGWGFSKEYFRYADGHVGLQTMLLNVGIVGFTYLIILYFYICLKIWLISRKLVVRSFLGSGIIIYLFSLIALFMIHTSSTQFWGFIIHFGQTIKVLTIAFLLASFNALVVHLNDND